MIAEYLFNLIDNCHILKRDPASGAIVRKRIQQEIDSVMSTFQVENEKILLAELTDPLGQKCHQLIESSKLCRIFFLVNSFCEYRTEKKCFDELGRFKFDYSYQKTHGITTNEVLQLITDVVNLYFRDVYTIQSHKSYFFLSHDIDSLYGSLVQDGAWALKTGRFDVLLKLFANAMIVKPHWFNISKIMRIESEYDFKSTFYWLVNKGKIDKRQTNSDYNINSKAVKESIRLVSANKFENGLHKSISAESMNDEIRKMPLDVIGNRFHYLKFTLPAAYREIEKSGLKLDASLGFAEHYGFRNSYGYPFHPFNAESGSHFSFLEVPLNIMDGTFQRYMKIPVNKTAETVISFIEKNPKNTLHSILWHNTFFTDYKYNGYLGEYKKILRYLYENEFRNINQSEILEIFSWKKK